MKYVLSANYRTGENGAILYLANGSNAMINHRAAKLAELLFEPKSVAELYKSGIASEKEIESFINWGLQRWRRFRILV